MHLERVILDPPQRKINGRNTRADKSRYITETNKASKNMDTTKRDHTTPIA